MFIVGLKHVCVINHAAKEKTEVLIAQLVALLLRLLLWELDLNISL